MIRRRFILVLVEGPSDAFALVDPLDGLLDSPRKAQERILATDVTTAFLFPVKNRLLDYTVYKDPVRTVQSAIETHVRRQAYEWRDVERIIHVLDMDGACVDDALIETNTGLHGVAYHPDHIETPDKDFILRRNQMKRDAVDRLVDLQEIKGKPYRPYFMSRNLEHALFDDDGDLEADAKSRLSSDFADDCATDPTLFARVLHDPQVSHGLGWQAAWDWVRAPSTTHSLERGSNYGTLLDDPNL